MTGPTPPIRHATPADLEALLALEEASFHSDRISRRQWRRYLRRPSVGVLVCGPPGDLSGAAVVFYRQHARVARLYSLAVRADRRGDGVGATLLEAAETDARGRGCSLMALEVQVGNRPAIGLYERAGYHRAARVAGYYEDGTDAWRYAKSMTAAAR